jgi:hypothetical protein
MGYQLILNVHIVAYCGTYNFRTMPAEIFSSRRRVTIIDAGMKVMAIIFYTEKS